MLNFVYGSVLTATVVAMVDSDQTADVLNQAAVSSANPDTDDSNNAANAPTVIDEVASLGIVKTGDISAEANGSISRIRFLFAIAVVILLLSWLNYINLATAKSLERAKETGIRKVAGAKRPQLIMQSLLESLLLN